MCLDVKWDTSEQKYGCAAMFESMHLEWLDFVRSCQPLRTACAAQNAQHRDGFEEEKQTLDGLKKIASIATNPCCRSVGMHCLELGSEF